MFVSDIATGPSRSAIPGMLAAAAVRHHLIREGERTEAGIVVETGEAREVHHFCLLAGYGAEAVNPYLALETIRALRDDLPASVTEEKAAQNFVKAVDKGLLKVMSKMGISTYQSDRKSTSLNSSP